MFLRVFVAITINPVVRIQRAHLIIQKYVQIKVFITDLFSTQIGQKTLFSAKSNIKMYKNVKFSLIELKKKVN